MSSNLLDQLASARRDRDRSEAELITVSSRARELKAEIRAADQRISDLLGDLVTPRPLLDYAEQASPEDQAPASEPPPLVPNWEATPIEQVLARANLVSLGLLLAKEELGTAGAIAEWLSNGDDFEDLEILDGDDRRLLNPEEIKVLRGCLVEWIGEQGIANDFPIEWVDPTLVPLSTFKLEFKPVKGKVRESIYLRAVTLFAASEYADTYWPKAAKEVRPHFEPIPDGARVEEIQRDSYADRVAAFRVEKSARLAQVED